MSEKEKMYIYRFINRKFTSTFFGYAKSEKELKERIKKQYGHDVQIEIIKKGEEDNDGGTI